MARVGRARPTRVAPLREVYPFQSFETSCDFVTSVGSWQPTEATLHYFTKSNLTVNFEDVKRGIICGRYDIYPVGDHQFVQNVFALTHEVDASPLLGLRILRCLSDARFIDAEGKSHFIETERVLEYFATIGVSAHCTRRWLDVMLKCGLIWSYDPTSRSVDQAKQIEISPCGLHHLAWGTTDWVYLESMSIVTPISDASTFQQMECYFNSGSTSARRLAIVKFIENAIREDKQVCLIPQHETFAGQHEIIVQLQAVAAELKGRIVSKSESRFFANDLETGRVVSWKDEGYGFVRSDRLPSDAFLHISQVLDKNITELAPWTVVAFQPEEKEKGFRATHVVIVN